MMLKQVVLVGMSLGFCLTQVHAKNYYKWVDSKGNVTYSSKQPPAGAKQQKIETLRSLGSTPATSTQRKEFKSNASIPTQHHNPYQGSNRTTYTPPHQPERSAEQQRLINKASQPIPGSRGLTTSQRNAIAGLSNTSNNVSNSAPTSSITNCDSAGCWGTDGTRYDKGAGSTYFPSTGGSCQNIGGQMQCN